jgi:hypothetical protein
MPPRPHHYLSSLLVTGALEEYLHRQIALPEAYKSDQPDSDPTK